MSDGASLNAKLAAMMPMASGEETATYTSLTPLVDSGTYKISVTPGTSWQAGISNPTINKSGDAGATVEADIVLAEGALSLNFNAGASIDLSDEETTEYAGLRVSVLIRRPK